MSIQDKILTLFEEQDCTTEQAISALVLASAAAVTATGNTNVEVTNKNTGQKIKLTIELE